ncbi:MAG: hypothetical protein HMLKMBBP_00041 [Planctomycetes bacterium]|nr:hypothetical protein [Planctomycetota bacterium]
MRAWAAVAGLAAGAVLGVVVGRATNDPSAETPSPAAAAREAELERQVADLNRRLADAKRPRAESERAKRDDVSEGENVRPDGAGGKPVAESVEARSPATDAASLATFTLEGFADGESLSKAFRAWAEAQLERGPAGYDAILTALVAVSKEQQRIEQIVGNDESMLAKELYPWLRTMVHHEKEMLGLTEHVFAKMAENSPMFAEMPKDDFLEMFTEGIGVIVPGAASEEQMQRLRGYAKKLIETPESSQSKAVRGVRSDVQRLLERFWAEPLTPESAAELLRSGAIDSATLQRAARLVPPEVLATVDLTAIVAGMIRKGDYRAARLIGTPPLDALDASRLEQAALDALDAGVLNGHMVADMQRRLGRASWSDIRPFMDRAFQLGERGRTAAAQVLWSLQGAMRPDTAWVEDLIARGAVGEREAASLRTMYGIK